MDATPSLPNIPFIFLEVMVPSLPCILSSWAMVQAHHSHSVLVPPNTGDISLTQTAEKWWWSSTQTQIQTMPATYPQVPIQQSKCTANLHQNGSAPHPSLYPLISAWSPSRENAVIHTFKAFQLSAWCKPNRGQTELSAHGPDHTSQRRFPCQPQSCRPPPFPLNLYPQARNLPGEVGNTGCFMNLLYHPPCHCSQ